MNSFQLMNCNIEPPMRVMAWDFNEFDLAGMDKAIGKATYECDTRGLGWQVWGYHDGIREMNWTYDPTGKGLVR